MKCVLEQNKDVKIYFIGIKQYKPFINGNLNFDDNLKMTEKTIITNASAMCI